MPLGCYTMDNDKWFCVFVDSNPCEKSRSSEERVLGSLISLCTKVIGSRLTPRTTMKLFMLP